VKTTKNVDTVCLSDDGGDSQATAAAPEMAQLSLLAALTFARLWESRGEQVASPDAGTCGDAGASLNVARSGHSVPRSASTIVSFGLSCVGG
jgi:hypothetical protein